MFAGLLLRLYHLTSLSLWHDEAFSALLVRYNWGEMMHRIGLDVHPPFYYIILRFWSYVFGTALWSLRGFSLVFGIASIFLVYKLIKTAFKSDRFALISALLFALNPFQIQFVSQARMYTLGTFLALLCAFFLIKAIETGRKKSKIIFYTLFALSGAAAMLTHYYLLFTIAAICFYALIYHFYTYGKDLKEYKLLILSYILLALGFLPWLRDFLVQYKRVGGGYWIPEMTIWSIPQTFWQMLTGINLNIELSSSKLLIAAATLFTLYFLYCFAKKTTSKHKWLIILCLIAPFGGAITFLILAKIQGAQTSVYLIRYFVFASIFYTIALAGWLETLENKTIKNFLLILVCALSIYGTWNYWKEIDVITKPGISGAANNVSNILKTDKIYVASSSQFFSFKFYNRTKIKPLLYTPGINSFEELPHYYGTALLTEDDITNTLPNNPENAETVWLIWTNGFYGSKPGVPGNWIQVSEQPFGEINFYTPPYNIYVTKYKIN